jgi:hypothetical protein
MVSAGQPVGLESDASGRRRIVLRRWWAIGGASVVSAAIVLLALTCVGTRLADLLAAPGWVLVAASTVLGAVCIRHARGRWPAFMGLRHLPMYPPLWVAGLGGAALLILALGTLSTVRKSVGLSEEHSMPLTNVGIAAAMGVGGLLVISAVWAAWSTTRGRRAGQYKHREDVNETSAALSLHGSFGALKTWLADDKPICRAEDDAFGHQRMAWRIATRLLAERPPAQAVVGRLGSGKTTVRNLVKVALDTSPSRARNVRIVPVELWPYETPRAAVEGVIRALVTALSCEVGVVALRGLPESYAEAMSSAGGIWSAVTRLQGTPSTPLESLRQIDDVATTIGCRYVVWVEDLERFAGRGGSSAEETPEDAERLNPIRALLYGLDGLQSVTVITATTSLHVRFDLEKIARFVEDLPQLDEYEVAKILASFRDGCRGNYDVIDPADQGVRKELDKLGDQQRLEARRAIRGPGAHSLMDALPALCATPRTLKQALRAALDTWERLAGEVDLDDLLAMSILREDQPHIFALVRQHIDALRGRGFVGTERENARQGWSTAFDKMQIDNLTRAAVGQIIKFVFGDSNAEIKPQGLKNRGHTDYWTRFLSVPVLSEAEQDQPVLRVVLGDDDEELLRLLEDDSRSGAVEAFARSLSTDRLRRLLVPLIRRRSGENPSGWAERVPPGMMPLWRMWLRRSESRELKPRAVLDEVSRAQVEAVPRNLCLAVILERYFVVPSNEVHDMLAEGTEGSAALVQEGKRHVRDLVVARYGGEPDTLADALVGADVPTLLWLCSGGGRDRTEAMTGEPFAGWPTLAATILDAARRRPAELIPQVACLLVRESPVSDFRQFARHYEFDDAAATSLFGSVEAVLEVFELHNPAQWVGIGPVEAVYGVVEERRGT